MAVKKSDLYSSLWKSCDELRGGMDASQYKDYVLVLLFVKYVSDRAGDGDSILEVPDGGSFADMVALKNKPHIGDGMNKVVGKLAEANDLRGVIDVADFNDDSKLGKGQEMVEKLTKLVAIFENPALDFSGNTADGDDLLGDAYEYLMRNFATESGKSKGQFYTPAEVSRIMAAVIGIDQAKSQKESIYDPTCGSGSLLLKAHATAKAATGFDLAIYGQEMDNATAALSRMNMLIHGAVGAEIKNNNTLAAPEFLDDKVGGLKTFEYVVANPPFSTKSWTNGVNTASDPYKRFSYGVPPEKNGDYAFLLHILASMKSTGHGAVILPHGVLFRGNAEATIRTELVKRGFIKGIIGLPANLFYGTGIPACIIVLDKEGAATRDSIFMIDASKGFAKDGAKNRLRERDIHKIIATFLTGTEIPKYSRLVPVTEIADKKNDYNLNLPRYIDISEPEDLHDLDAHLHGGIPDRDLDELNDYWEVLPSLRSELVNATDRAGYSVLAVPVSDLSQRVTESPEFKAFESALRDRLDKWSLNARVQMMAITSSTRPKQLIVELSESLLSAFNDLALIDAYDVYQSLMQAWEEYIKDDVYLIVEDGWVQGARLVALPAKKKGEKRTGRVDFTVKKVDYRSELLPRPLMTQAYFAQASADADAALAVASEQLADLAASYGGDDMLLAEYSNDAGEFTRKSIEAALKRKDLEPDERAALVKVLAALDSESAAKAALKAVEAELVERYSALDASEVARLLTDVKWLGAVALAVDEMLGAKVHHLVSRISELDRRYRRTLGDVRKSALDADAELTLALAAMGWQP